MALLPDNGTRQQCQTAKCSLMGRTRHKFWYRYVSEMLGALCREKESFQQIYEGCQRSKRAMSDDLLQTLFDFYDGALFRRKYGEQLRKWDEDTELYVFLTFSSDGFEEFRTRTGNRTSWPVVFIILTLEPKHRSRATNALISAFIPGSHESSEFDSFLNPIVLDLVSLQKGIQVMCADGKMRLLKAFVFLGTFDYPGGSKPLGFMGHMALHLCRMCHKKKKHIDEINGRSVLPSSSKQIRSAAASGNREESYLKWIDGECPERRSDFETRQVWKQLDKLERSSARGSKAKLKRLQKETGILRNPVLGRLTMDFVHSIPYDPMHLLFLGWVKLLISLLCGFHPKTTSETPYAIPCAHFDALNESLRTNYSGIPACWGRGPESLEYESSFKAEDYKNFPLFYGPVLFSGLGVDRRVSKLWRLTSDIVCIARDPTPSVDDHEELESLVQMAHATFSQIFHIDASHAFCFTPNTHALLHLHDALLECGPLPNISQFLLERLVGEVGNFISSMVRPEANLFHKTQKLFCLRLLNGGLGVYGEKVAGHGAMFGRHSPVDEGCSDEHGGCTHDDDYHTLGCGTPIATGQEMQRVVSFIEQNILCRKDGLRIVECMSFDRMRVGHGDDAYDIETEANFFKRENTDEDGCRQKFWIAAVFENESVEVSRGQKAEVYNGRVKRIWRVSFKYRDVHEQLDQFRVTQIAQFEWQYGIREDRWDGTPSVKNGTGPRRGSTRHTMSTIECVTCVDRLIGVFDHRGKRFSGT